MPNALLHAASPYLRQHADNAVDWLEWGEPAFALARQTGRPIFLSIGYSTCHWCHVMAHECFEDAEIGAQLNAHFINIKVDREERPDLDRIYMAYVQAVTGHGGWPLSVWLTPGLQPFFGGTYFPPKDHPGRPGLPAVTRAIAEGWSRDRARVEAEGERIVAALAEQQGGAPVGEAEPDLTEPAGDAFEQAYTYLFENYDAEFGGFGGAPKFPRPSNLGFLLRCAVLQGPESESGTEALAMVGRSLRGMALGGIHDHVGGGFHRYAVDDGWLVPHFEKMLSDQAQIAVVLIDARAGTGEERFGWVARALLEYVARELTQTEGGFFAAQDADSRRVDGTGPAEGAFYGWSHAELLGLLGEDLRWFAPLYGVKETGNVPASLDPHAQFAGMNLLAQRKSLAEVAAGQGLDPEALVGRLARHLETLRHERDRRPHPHRDEKVITAWNGMMIAAFARASMSGAEALAPRAAEYVDRAVRAAEFVRRELWREGGGVLLRSWCAGRSGAMGFAEDHAALIYGLLELFGATLDLRWLQWADELQAVMDAAFWDAHGGGYFQTRVDGGDVILRLKDDHDGAEPSANSLAASNLLRLAALLDDEAYRHRGGQVLQGLRPVWSRTPWALPALLTAMEWALAVPRRVLLLGDPTSSAWREMQRVAIDTPGPRRVVLGLSGAPGERWLFERVPAWAGWVVEGAGTQAVICTGTRCEAPIDTAEALAERLRTPMD